MSLWLAGYPKTPDFDVRFGSKADIKAPQPNVRFTPKSGRAPETPECPLVTQIGRRRRGVFG